MNLQTHRRLTNIEIDKKIPIKNPLTRDMVIQFLTYDGDKFLIIITLNNSVFDLPPIDPNTFTGSAVISLSNIELFNRVQSCREVWQKVVVDFQEIISSSNGGERKSFPFQDDWNFQTRSQQFLNEVGKKLAIAGNKLFNQIFEGNEALNQIGDYLKQSTSIRPLVINIVSDIFFVPWGMLYIHPRIDEEFNRKNGSNFDWQGFWGLRHIIEHKTRQVNLDNQLRLDSWGKISTCINVDNKLDNTKNLLSRPVSELKEFLTTLTIINLKVNSTREEFFNTLTESDFSAKFLYFYCHGQGAGDPQNPNSGNSSHITLTDNEKITVEDIQYILQQKDLICSPFVFINACQGGQMTTLFYKTIGAEFLKRKSLGLIGPQIDMPIVFAAEYAQRFFQIFIGSQEPVRIGCLMKRLSNDFLFLHKNPLGLAYSLYHGADCYIDRDSEIS